MTAVAKYILRLDDASGYMDSSRWEPFFGLADRYCIKPIVGVIPFNRDPKLTTRSLDEHFWDKVRTWQGKGYLIGMHGYEHLYVTRNGGILGKSDKSEFAGLPLDEQKSKLAAAFGKFKDERVTVSVFVAPSHSFDRNTLLAIHEVTGIRIISDGFFINPVIKNGFRWIPQQLWGPKEKKRGVWTICCHPETSDASILSSLEIFLKDHHNEFTDPSDLEFGRMKSEDFLYSGYMLLRNRTCRFVKRFI